MAESKWVVVRNPDLPDAPAAVVPRASLEALQEKGFEVVEDSDIELPRSVSGKGSEPEPEPAVEEKPKPKGKDEVTDA